MLAQASGRGSKQGADNRMAHELKKGVTKPQDISKHDADDEIMQLRRRFKRQNYEIIRVNARYAAQLRELELQRSELAGKIFDLHAEVARLTSENERLVQLNVQLQRQSSPEKFENLQLFIQMALESLESFLDLISVKALLFEEKVVPGLKRMLQASTVGEIADSFAFSPEHLNEKQDSTIDHYLHNKLPSNDDLMQIPTERVPDEEGIRPRIRSFIFVNLELLVKLKELTAPSRRSRSNFGNLSPIAEVDAEESFPFFEGTQGSQYSARNPGTFKLRERQRTSKTASSRVIQPIQNELQEENAEPFRKGAAKTTRVTKTIKASSLGITTQDKSDGGGHQTKTSKQASVSAFEKQRQNGETETMAGFLDTDGTGQTWADTITCTTEENMRRTRRRTPIKSYALPSLRSKLRQGDEFTIPIESSAPRHGTTNSRIPISLRTPPKKSSSLSPPRGMQWQKENADSSLPTPPKGTEPNFRSGSPILLSTIDTV
ncbi:uncharacterized protein SPPG_06090 [Spizellomyces punctatus DAOM BR117]|uniref:Shugoshin C-terminal domain-containing protein n=1 Tax=Spizellomyces punctatus (strain DAOM BR117) TaxID=645134 RepID=A0A0L0HC75_SPIPD|nr:uncharacterized protein SPPG_06090 [Spizellomyces punctatus DAOM BR117]KNC98383.1 hypothetical protein SPPG_06090 [Spizellomyces punctatus DAOM BR117]|eukprot:XP_016606423.1 hypothetical protein SPPG_06090 [Spizellomyces punctatus DAOM BR117]